MQNVFNHYDITCIHLTRSNVLCKTGTEIKQKIAPDPFNAKTILNPPLQHSHEFSPSLIFIDFQCTRKMCILEIKDLFYDIKVRSHSQKNT